MTGTGLGVEETEGSKVMFAPDEVTVWQQQTQTKTQTSQNKTKHKSRP